MCFLGTFSGHWPSAVERASFSFRTIFYPLEQLFTQVHFRYFKLIDTLNDNVGSDGLQCHRQRGKIPPSSPGRSPLQFEERRISIFGILSAPHRFNDFGSFLYKPSIYRVLILSEDDLRFPLCNLIDDSKLKWWPGLGAAVAFQTAIFLTVSVWEREWNKVLDQIEDSLSVELDETLEPKQISKWMFDLDFDRSRLYFTVLQVLRIFGECIRAVSADLSPFDRLFSPSTSSSYWDVSTDELLAYSSNWKSVTKHQKDTEERLLRRLLDKTEEVKSLRDGLFNASSLREARQSTTMNRYVIIFTVVTVLYLPPSFVSTVFGMTIFQKSVDQTTHEYKVTTVVVSLITYLVAIASVIAVDWVHIKRIILKWRDFVLKKSSVNGNSDPETVPENPAGPSHKSRPGDNEKKSGQSNAPQDVESAIDEEAGQATKSRFSWQKWLSKLPST
ncbi:hypothetical protein N431DRAFT_244483 [Stipitochalara longipes BDJ]|nr:hypothetical protein N431DRAFT_244483 [Stipitochalara longipes BDJ]